MRIKLDQPEWKRVINALKIKVPLLIDKMAYNVLANTAAEARESEQSIANTLQLGVMQHTSRRRKSGQIDVIERVNLKKTNAGWVSTTRRSSKTGDFQMSHFAFERARTKHVKVADYTNQLANLWHRPSKPYRTDSPEVGPVSGRRTVWKKGKRRPVRYNWSTVEAIVRAAAPAGIRKTEAQFNKFLKEI